MNNPVIEILEKIGSVIRNDHFVYTSGMHGEVYINKDALYPHTEETSKICRLFAEKYKDKGIDAIAGPALGGIILSQWTAYHMSQITGKEVLGVYAEKTKDENQIFRRGYDQLISGKNILVVEDLTTTGGSVRKVVDSARQVGANIVGVCVMVNRDTEKVTTEVVGAPFDSLAVLPAKAYPEVECPFCKEGRPININIGHGKAFLEKKNG